MPPSVRVVSAAESAALDRATIEKGSPSRVLMQRAGTAAAEEISGRYPGKVRRGALIFTGPGNNGGDGWVVAGALARSGVDVTVVEVVDAKTPDAVAEKSSIVERVKRVAGASKDVLSARAGIVIDALLGTGAEGKPHGAIADAISTINELKTRGAAVVALDVPSGLDASTGLHDGCVIADMTLSFGSLKRGTLVARDCCGEIVVLDIGLDDGSQPKLPFFVDGPWARSRIPRIPFDAHKGTRKHLAILGGAWGTPGAVVLATRAALRSGIGMVRAFVARESVSDTLKAAPEALVSDWPTDAETISEKISKWAHGIVVGPGLGKSDEARKVVESVLGDSKVPVLLDADALNIFAGDRDSLARLVRDRPALITPHVAEFSRLAGVSVREVLDQRFDIGGPMAKSLGATVLLKGTPTVVYTPTGERYVIARGTAALGTGGSGDLLAGIAGTLLAQTADPVAAGCAAAWMHGHAAELCEYVRGTTLDDVLYALPRAWNEPVVALRAPVLVELPGLT